MPSRHMGGTPMPRFHAYSRVAFAWLPLLVMALAIGCETPPAPYVPKAKAAPPVVYCNDNTGHKAGSAPWVLGGTCCCTPSDELVAQFQKSGVCQGMTADDLAAKYKAAGIALRGPGHQHCNGICPAGPHVVLGGKCLCPPTPGTETYDQIVTGQGVPPRKGASSPPTAK